MQGWCVLKGVSREEPLKGCGLEKPLCRGPNWADAGKAEAGRHSRGNVRGREKQQDHLRGALDIPVSAQACAHRPGIGPFTPPGEPRPCSRAGASQLCFDVALRAPPIFWLQKSGAAGIPHDQGLLGSPHARVPFTIPCPSP